MRLIGPISLISPIHNAPRRKTMSDRINRREFIKRGATTGAGAGLTLGMSRRAGAAFDNTDSPNGRVTLGFIGTGARAHQVIDDVMKVPGCEGVALCSGCTGR